MSKADYQESGNVDLQVDLAGIKLKKPVLLASGPAGYGHEYRELLDFKDLGAIIVKGVSLEPWAGNPPPRLVETSCGLLNAVGLQNPGLDYFLKEDLPALQDSGTKIIVNVVGCNVDEYAAVASRLDGKEGIEGLEINISCPNVKAGGMAFGTDPEVTARLVEQVRRKTELPLFIKLSPNVTDINTMAKAAEAAGADGLTLINTLAGMLIDTEEQKPLLGNTFGGLSGPAIMPVALKMVWQAAGAVKIPVLGMGGINSAVDALQFIMAGARAVAVGTGLFYNPGLPGEINKGLAGYLQEKGYKSLTEIEGIARGQKGEN
ncbi:MAG: dihydroorotate dehydrogenase [Bacillota bacterium]